MQAITWRIEENGGFETAWAQLSTESLTAVGRAVGVVPQPYWLNYELTTGPGFVTRRLHVEVQTATSTRRLELSRADSGAWTANGLPVRDVEGALDCDLGLSPLTNTMPILRHHLHRDPGSHDFVMAWVSVPDLVVHRSDQAYRHLHSSDKGATVEYSSGDRSYVADLEVDADGLVITYPGLGQRI